MRQKPNSTDLSLFFRVHRSNWEGHTTSRLIGNGERAIHHDWASGAIFVPSSHPHILHFPHWIFLGEFSAECPSGMVTCSILFGWLFTMKDHPKKTLTKNTPWYLLPAQRAPKGSEGTNTRERLEATKETNTLPIEGLIDGHISDFFYKRPT